MAELNEEKNVETEVTTAKRGPKAASTNNDAKIAELNKQLEEMQAAFAKQKDQIQMLLAAMSSATTQGPHTDSLNDTIKIVHLVQRAPGLFTFIKLSSIEIAMENFGEERLVTIQQFEEMVSKYRSWFNSGMISVAAGYEKVAERYGLKTTKSYPIDGDFVKELGNLPMDKIEEVYPKLPESGKDFVLGLWNRKVIEGDPKFRDIRKIETLNRLSDGALDQVILELKIKK